MDIMLKNILNLIDSNYQKDEDFEKEFGIAKSTVSAWRRGKLMSYQKYATKIATFFNVSSDWLSGNNQKNKPAAQSDELKEAVNEIVMKLDRVSDDGLAKIADYIEMVLAQEAAQKQNH